MAYDWANSGFAPTGTSDDEQKLQRDMLQAQLQQEILNRRNSMESQQAEGDFNRQMKILQQSNEYNNSTIEKRANLEAQLIALQKGYIKPNFGSPQQMNGGSMGNDNIVDEVLGIGGMLGGGYAGYANRGLMSSGITKAGQALTNAGTFGDIGNGLLQKGSVGLKQGTAKAVNSLSPKVKNSILRTLLQGAETGAMDASVGMANLGSKIAGKGSTKLAGKAIGAVGAKAGGKVIGTALGGLPGFLIGTALGEIIGNMLESDDEKERAKAQYILSNYR